MKISDFIYRYKTVAYQEELKAEYKKLGQSALGKILNKLKAENKITDSKIWFNPGGIGVSGDHHIMVMFTPDIGIHLFFNMEVDLGICYRVIKHMKDYSGGANNWCRFDVLDNPEEAATRMRTLAQLKGSQL